MLRRPQLWVGILALALLIGGYLLLRPHPIVGRWELDLPATSSGTGKRLILLSDGTGDLDGQAFRYRIVDGKNLVVTYPDRTLYVWPFDLDEGRLTVTIFKETDHFRRAEPDAPSP